jgi:hypothetical protein
MNTFRASFGDPYIEFLGAIGGGQASVIRTVIFIETQCACSLNNNFWPFDGFCKEIKRDRHVEVLIYF